ncbi:MAG: hypothetical protein OXN89_25300 [Bryobacterales bacterium]|nr:hypothetical protein [Bryobacterales bacterium]
MNDEPIPLPVPTRGMRMDLRGRLRNTKVAAHNAFLPVFEAVVNGMHSIEDRFGLENAAASGEIEIHVHRVLQHQVPGTAGRPLIEPIEGFTVVDNGVGFTDPNMESFETADSSAKIERGGKGIGRLTWLVVFEKAEIESRFLNDEHQLRRRSFIFSPTEAGISDFSDEELESEQAIETRICLLGAKERYREPLRKGLDVIAERVFEHCFNYFAVGNCPQVTVIEHGADGDSKVVVNELTKQLAISEPNHFAVGEHKLVIRHVQERHTSGKKHLGHLLANDRVVSSFPLADVSDLGANPIHGEQGEPLVHHVFVGGTALDSGADATRTRFVLPDGEQLIEAIGLLDLKTLRERIGEIVNDQLKETLQAEREANLEKIERHIRTEQPEYARLLGKKREELAHIKWSDNPRLMDEALYRLKQDWELEIRQQQSAIEEQLNENETNVDEVAEQLYRVVSETNLAGQDDLVRYVVKRRAVLKLLHRLISRQAGTLEKHVHRIVFPLRKTNGEVDYNDHNLWLVDDALAFYEFVSSDVSLSANTAAPSSSLRRPDILAFKTGDPYEHVSIVEFKKPDRNDGENPVVQLAAYARLLRQGEPMDVDGVTIPGVDNHIRIDAYAIVTLNRRMESVLCDGPGEMKKVEGEWRWYGAMGNLNMNVEVLDFRAFISRARKRNQAFFSALNLR